MKVCFLICMLVVQALNAAEYSFDSVGANHAGSIAFARMLGKLPSGKCKEHVEEFFTPTETAFTSMYTPLADFSYVPDDSVKAVRVGERAEFFDRNFQDFVNVMYQVWHKNSMTPAQCMNLYSCLYSEKDVKFFLLSGEDGKPVSARMHLYFLHNDQRVSQGWHGCVPGAFRGKGYGPTLMKYAMYRDRDDGVDVFINEAAPAAVSAWTRAGLKDSGRRIVKYTRKRDPSG